MNCLIALKMSANLPLIFDKFKYNGMYYQDGGLGNNYPVNIVDNGINKILGIRLKNHFDMGSTNIMDYIFKIIHTPIRQNEDVIIQKSSNKCKHILLESKDTSPFNYNLPVTQKLDMFSYGYRQIQKKI
jgi:predicted acylesterase/phospholipase RssA